MSEQQTERKDAFDILKDDENLVILAIDDLSEDTKQAIIEDQQEARDEIMRMESMESRHTARGPSNEEIRRLLEQRDKTIKKLESFSTTSDRGEADE